MGSLVTGVCWRMNVLFSISVKNLLYCYQMTLLSYLAGDKRRSIIETYSPKTKQFQKLQICLLCHCVTTGQYGLFCRYFSCIKHIAISIAATPKDILNIHLLGFFTVFGLAPWHHQVSILVFTNIHPFLHTLR